MLEALRSGYCQTLLYKMHYERVSLFEANACSDLD